MNEAKWMARLHELQPLGLMPESREEGKTLWLAKFRPERARHEKAEQNRLREVIRSALGLTPMPEEKKRAARPKENLFKRAVKRLGFRRNG